jgi:hypothetical protein
MTKVVRSLGVTCALALVFVAIASAADWAGSDPAKNYPLGKLPASCDKAPNGAACINAGVYYLDKARAKLGLPPYALPADFPSLTAAQQMFILTNLDRVEYGLPPMTGLTADLNSDAYKTGIKTGDDPFPSASEQLELQGWTSNWAGSYDNAPMAYEGWMYDDGLGSPNLDCSKAHRSGCWDHRHDILWKFDSGDVLAAGAASGNGPYGESYALLLVEGYEPDPYGDPGYTPTYSYTWSQAVADGAGTNAYDPGNPLAIPCHVPGVLGETLVAATRAIGKAHCSVGRVLSKYTVYLPGLVILQSQEPGSGLAAGAKIDLVLSLGPRP